MRRTILLTMLVLNLLCQPGRLDAQEWRVHRVARGENLTTIARHYNVTINDLRVWNDLANDRILVGQRLRIPAENQEWYVVRPGDTLSEIAQRHDIGISLLRSLNNISGSTIHPGQRLQLRPSPLDVAVHVVRHGAHLTGIAQRYGLTVSSLKRINGLSGDRITVGQKLHLREAEASVHIVERGDALWEIARAYGLSVDELKSLNGLTSSRIYPGQELNVGATESPKLVGYTVRTGDNLNDIARLHQMTLRELRSLNSISGSLIHPGQTLQVRPMLGAGHGTHQPTRDWTSLAADISGVRKIGAANGPYFSSAPRASTQRNSTYKEEPRISPKACYNRARQLFDHFAASVDELGQLSNRLAGWHFVLDPGHGGVDPGAIVEGRDPQGESFHIVEDEYVYDLTLRVYVLLRQHGADVTLTLLSSNHLLRGNDPANATFVHDHNEVFNDAQWNSRNRRTTWPKGGQTYLDERIAVARRAWRNTPPSRQVFLSFHADNDPVAGDAVTLFYQQNRNGTDTLSRGLARKLLPAMGAGARIKGRGLGVLRTNPAHYKLLVEMRNLAFEEHRWAIRYEQLRQRDAEKVVRALLEGLAPDGAVTTASP